MDALRFLKLWPFVRPKMREPLWHAGMSVRGKRSINI